MSIARVSSDLKRKLALRLIRRALQIVEDLYWLLARVEKLLLDPSVALLPRPALARLRPAVRPVLSVDLQFEFDGSATVAIDGSEEFRLSPLLASLLAILIEDSGASDDSIVGWKTYREIRQRLFEKHGKKTISKHALQNCLYQLRNELEKRGFSRDLIQCVRHLGYRFAIRRAVEASLPGKAAGASGREETGDDP